MDAIKDLYKSEKIKERATKLAHASASAEASGATQTTVGNATVDDDDGLISSSAADMPQSRDDEATIDAKRMFHSYVTMHIETESQNHLKLHWAAAVFGAQLGPRTSTMC